MATSNSFAACARFDDFHVDLKGGILQRSGVRLPVQSQPLQVLPLLLQAQGKVVTRDEQGSWLPGDFEPPTFRLTALCLI
jgi:DNA-binding response OmpR family regulator